MLTGAGSHRKETSVSVVRALPDRPSLANLKRQAKSLLAAWQAGDRQALARLRDVHPRGGGQHRLADAQFVLAREYGFATWSRLVHHLRLSPVAQALHTMDELFRATLAPAGAPNTVGSVLDRRVDLVWHAHLEGRPAAAGFLR